MPVEVPDPFRVVLGVAVLCILAGLVLWMHGWGQRRPSLVGQTGTFLIAAGGITVGMIATALCIGLIVSGLSQAVQARVAGPRQEQTPVR